MKLPYFLKFGIKSTTVFFIVVIVAGFLEAYLGHITEKGGLVMWLLILLVSPLFWSLRLLGLPSSFDSSPAWSLLVIYFLYFFTVFSTIGILIGAIKREKKSTSDSSVYEESWQNNQLSQILIK